MKDGFKRSLVLVPLVGLLLIMFGTTGFGSLTGNMESDLSLTHDSTSLISLNSTLELNYSLSGVNFQSVSEFEKNDFTGQKFGADLSVGLAAIGSTLSFDTADLSETNLNYWLTEVGFDVGGLNVDNAFVLEVLEGSPAYGSGYKLSLSGELGSGSRIYLNNYFGMEENEAEALGMEDGSGYTIVTDDGTYGPSALQYVETRVEVTGLSYDCCQLHTTTKISEEEGFEYSLFEFDLEAENLPLKFYTDLRFTPEGKSVELEPRLDTDWACFDVYTGLRTSNGGNKLVGGGDSTIEALVLEGFGLTDLKLGKVSFSSLTVLEGRLFRLAGEDDLDLRANDYVLNPDPVFSGLYEETDYDGALTLENSGADSPLFLAVDAYFNRDSGGGLFDFGLFTGVGTFRFSEQFTAGAGVKVKPDEVETVRFELDYYF